MNLITTYTTRLDSLVQGGHGHRKMIQHCNSAFRQLRRDVRNTAPEFVPQTELEARKARAKASRASASATLDLFNFSKVQPLGAPKSPAPQPTTIQFQPPPAPASPTVANDDLASDDSDAEMDSVMCELSCHSEPVHLLNFDSSTESRPSRKSLSSPIYLDDLKRMISR